MRVNEFIGVTALFYSLANPIGVIPIFLALAKSHPKVSPRRIILLASMSVASFLTLSAISGSEILSFFHVGLDDFRIAGGLLALFVAFEMFQAKYGGIIQTPDEKQEAESEIHGIAITPLAFPLLVGPAEMSVMITLASERPDWPDRLWLIASSIAVSSMIAITLWMAVPINRVLGKTGINVATRVMALIVAAIGVKFIMTGIKNEIPGLAA